jgi:hypothetical protein
MYLKTKTDISLVELSKLLDPNASAESLSYDYENVYEWVYLYLKKFDLTLNISRDHGEWRENEDVILGPTYFCAHSEEAQSLLNESNHFIAQWIANKLGMDIAIHSGVYNVDQPESECLKTLVPSLRR